MRPKDSMFTAFGDFLVNDEAVDAAEEEFAEQSERSQDVDKQKRAPVTTNFQKWENNPKRWDFPSVDTPTDSPSVMPKDLKTEDKPRTTNTDTPDGRTVVDPVGNQERGMIEFGAEATARDISLEPGEAFEGLHIQSITNSFMGPSYNSEKGPVEQDRVDQEQEPPEQALQQQSIVSQAPDDIDTETLQFAKEREGELVGRRPTAGKEFQVGRIMGVNPGEGRVEFQTVKNQPYSGEKEKQSELRVFSDRGFFDLREDIKEEAGPGTYAIEGNTLFTATAGGMGGGKLEEEVTELDD